MIDGRHRRFKKPDDFRGIQIGNIHDVSARVVSEIHLVQFVIEKAESVVLSHPALVRITGFGIG